MKSCIGNHTLMEYRLPGTYAGHLSFQNLTEAIYLLQVLASSEPQVVDCITVTTSVAPVTTSVALVSNSFLVTTSKAPVTTESRDHELMAYHRRFAHAIKV